MEISPKLIRTEGKHHLVFLGTVNKPSIRKKRNNMSTAKKLNPETIKDLIIARVRRAKGRKIEGRVGKMDKNQRARH